MPELAEVEFFRKRWHLAAIGQRVSGVRLHPHAKVFRGTSAAAIRRNLTGAKLVSSATAAKQMLFCFQRAEIRARSKADASAAAHGVVWLGIHLGMSGELSVQPPGYSAQKHDHLIVDTEAHALVFSDPRMFGRVLLHVGSTPPDWWAKIAPAILTAEFTTKTVAAFLRRRSRAPLKAVLLMQEQFPGIGNWMADEILWRAGIHPRRAAGSLTTGETAALWRECRRVCRMALDTIAGRGNTIPTDLNVNIPESWLFRHRWRKGGHCPRTGVPLVLEEIGGRTTCWSPARQALKSDPPRKSAALRRRARSASLTATR